MDNQPYTDPILKKYIALIESNTKRFKRIYYGEPVRIGSSELPALVISKIDTRVTNMTNAEDRHEIRISLTVVTDIRDTITDDKLLVAGVNSLYNIMEGREETTYKLKADSLLGILRHNVELDIAQNLRTDLSNMTMVSYGMTMGKRAPESWSIEGTLELTANFSQTR